MLHITTEPIETYDEEANEFHTTPGRSFKLEHSLISVSKWEAKWNVAFLGKQPKTPEMLLDYVRCMVVGPEVTLEELSVLSDKDLETINAYIEEPMTATKFTAPPGTGGSQETMTAELIYYYMIQFGIPWKFEQWHLGRLMTLIRVCGIKSQPGKRMPNREVLNQHRALNAARKAKLNTKG